MAMAVALAMALIAATFITFFLTVAFTAPVAVTFVFTHDKFSWLFS
jgi:hypothetical protein